MVTPARSPTPNRAGLRGSRCARHARRGDRTWPALGDLSRRRGRGGWRCPYLLLSGATPPHVGTLDIDLDLDPERLAEGAYVEFVETLLQQNQVHPYPLRSVPGPGSGSAPTIKPASVTCVPHSTWPACPRRSTRDSSGRADRSSAAGCHHRGGAAADFRRDWTARSCSSAW
jgi:hypothetical protein